MDYKWTTNVVRFAHAWTDPVAATDSLCCYNDEAFHCVSGLFFGKNK